MEVFDQCKSQRVQSGFEVHLHLLRSRLGNPCEGHSKCNQYERETLRTLNMMTNNGEKVQRVQLQ